MQPNKKLFPFVLTILLMLACVTGKLSAPTPSAAQPQVFTIARTVTPPPTWMAISTPFPTNVKTDPIPAWVTEFADPILNLVADRTPNFQDDFSHYRGWFHVLSGIDGHLYAELQDGTLYLELPERTKDSYAYNPKINRGNFVLTLELRFYHSQPNDTVRLQFDRSANESIAFDLSNNRNWELHWASSNGGQSITGTYPHFPPEHIPVTIIVQGTQCAVYLNHEPLAYADDCATTQSKPWAVTFRLLRDSARDVIVNFDNLKLWDLDRTLP